MNQMTVLLFEREPGHWVAQCLEYDIGAQADSLPNLFYEFQRSFVGHLAICHEHGEQPFSNLGKAPDEYFSMLGRGRRVDVQPHEDDFPLRDMQSPVDASPSYVLAG